MSLSRQRLWQLKQVEQGLCCKCAEKLHPDSSNFCTFHMDDNRDRNRANARIRAGIPLDRPIHPTIGRPRGKKT